MQRFAAAIALHAVSRIPLGPAIRYSSGVRFLLLLPLLLFTACAQPQPPRGHGPSAKPPPGRPAASKPRWQPAPARADGAAVPGGRRHIVKAGETGLGIARAYGVPWGRIAEANRLDREAVIRVGQALFIPTGGQAAARPGQRPASGAAFESSMDDVISGASVASGAPGRPATRPSAPPPPAVQVPALSWPVDGRVILSGFGPKPGGRVNDGINIKALRGGTVRAAADGEVIYVGDAIEGFGLLMLVRHAGGVVTAYGHLEDALADRGDKVQRGQPIARAGSSGEAKEPQLLFQVRQGRRALNPTLYLPK